MKIHERSTHEPERETSAPFHRPLVIVVVALTVFSTAPAFARLGVDAGYSASADLFVLMDEVSLWSNGGFNDPEYREYWTQRFGWNAADADWAERYAEFRRRTYSDPGQAESDPATASDGLFAKRSSFAEATDPLAVHFFRAASLADARAGLEDRFGPEDGAMLAGFYAHFERKWREILAESTGFSERAAALNDAIAGPTVDAWLGRLVEFYGVEIDRDFRAFHVWWPPIDRTSAGVSVGAFLIKSHPERHAGETGWEGIVMHELVHYVSAHIPPERKQAMTKRFLERCDAEIATGFYDLLEEPLAVAVGNAGFARFAQGEPLAPEASWYWRPMPDLMGRLMWPHVERAWQGDATLDDSGIVETAGRYCARLLQIDALLSPAAD